MGWFSSTPAADTLPTTTPAPATASTSAPGTPKAKATDAVVPEKKGLFCGMSLTEILIAIVIFGLFFFFVLWPLITAYFMLACMWIIMWPFVKYIPMCGEHKYVKPLFTVLGVVVTSPVKVVAYLYKTFKGGKSMEDVKAEATTAAAMTVVNQAVASQTAAAATPVATKV